MSAGKAAKETKSLADLGEWFKANGVDGRFTLEDLYAPVDHGGGNVFTPVRPVGLVSGGTFSDAVDNKIRWTFCGIELFDSEENAKKAVKDPETDFVNGRFRMWTSKGGIHRGKEKNLVYVFSQFHPYR